MLIEDDGVRDAPNVVFDEQGRYCRIVASKAVIP